MRVKINKSVRCFCEVNILKVRLGVPYQMKLSSSRGFLRDFSRVPGVTRAWNKIAAALHRIRRVLYGYATFKSVKLRIYDYPFAAGEGTSWGGAVNGLSERHCRLVVCQSGLQIELARHRSRAVATMSRAEHGLGAKRAVQ